MGNTSPQGAISPVKFPMDAERKGITRKFILYGDEASGGEIYKGYFTINVYEDGTPGELAIFMNKVGAFEHGFATAFATAVTMLLQYGVDPREIYSKFKHMDFEPSGITGVPSVPMAKSLIDLIMKFMECNFPPTGSRDMKELDEYETALQSMSEEENKR